MKWKKDDGVEEQERHIRANDPDFNKSFNYADNYISTSKYNFVTFLPKNLFEQFQRLANAYFLFLLFLQLIPQISSVPYYTTLLPLVFVLAASAAKEAWDDIQRHRSDSQVNNRKSYVLRNGQIVEEPWYKVVVGDIIRMTDDQFVAADLFLLSSSEPNSLCYIETAELDGETNLKVRQALPATAKMHENLEQLSAFDAELLGEAPNNVLSKYEGKLVWNGQDYSLDNEKILLRGCVLRNTRWCFGLVIFAGKDTKLMQNSGKTVFKRTHIDRLMNFLIIGIFIFLAAMCLMCTIGCGVWESLVGIHFQAYLPWESYVPDGRSAGSTVIAILVFLSYIIVLNTVVPISLYVCVEITRLCHSWWINWDCEMYYAKNDTPARARTTTLNEELGQIEYIFSDKTGTLTQNIMTFNKCSINGVSYGDYYDEKGNPLDITENTPTVDFSANPYYEKKFIFYDQRLRDLSFRGNDEDVNEFFLCLALCHTIMSETKDGVLAYQAQSPDEEALVAAARNFGFVFITRTPTTITISVRGKEEVYELLNILDFNNVRKRMSVIVKKDDRLRLYCKGADSKIFERLLIDSKTEELQESVTGHLNDFAQDGLRTLCLARKDIDPHVYTDWAKRYLQASTSLKNRDDLLDTVYDEIEQNLTLIGATAIEDKLQDGVPETIANLAMAGIKIWVLTGDKQETAINIGYSCKLLTDEMEDVFVIDGETYEEVLQQMEEAKQAMAHQSNTVLGDHSADIPLGNRPGAINIHYSPDDPEFGGYALVINGHSLVHALVENMEKLLLEVGCMCKAVICCRVTPLQKAMVVDLVKRNKQSITLAIGDGANDVSMIKMAHIGVGISGQEGLQAVLASDFAIAQFRYLERLLFVHGRWSYLRMCKFLKYFFYKNFAFTLCNFWFAFYCGFTAQTLYDDSFISLYNLCYTSLPVLVLAIFDQDVNDDFSIRYPKLYYPGHLDLFFNKKVFGISLAEGVLSSLVLFFIPFGAFHDAIGPDGTDLSDHKAFGLTVATCLLIVVTLRCALDTTYWTGFHHFVIWGSIAFFFGFTFIFYSEAVGYSMYVGTATTTMSTARFWLTVLLTSVVLLLPVIAERFYEIDTSPTLTDKVRLKQKVSRAQAKSRNLVLRRASSRGRKTTHKARSGYAFAHSEGFGRLIMTGINMFSRSQMHLEDGALMETQSQPSLASTTGTKSSKSPRGRPTQGGKDLRNPAGRSVQAKPQLVAFRASDTSVISDGLSIGQYSAGRGRDMKAIPAAKVSSEATNIPDANSLASDNFSTVSENFAEGPDGDFVLVNEQQEGESPESEQSPSSEWNTTLQNNQSSMEYQDRNNHSNPVVRAGSSLTSGRYANNESKTDNNFKKVELARSDPTGSMNV